MGSQSMPAKSKYHTERSPAISTEDNKAIASRLYEEVWDMGNVAAVDELIAPNMVDHFHYPAQGPAPAEYQLSLVAFKDFVSQFHTTFPDFQYTVELQVAEGDLVVTRLTARGTHTGEYRGLTYKSIPPTGKQITWTYTAIDRIHDGKIVERWSNGDDLGRLQQLGVIPMLGQASK
jgi:predicted ester cyclase